MVLHTACSCGSKPTSRLKLQPMVRGGWRLLGSTDRPDCLQRTSGHTQDISQQERGGETSGAGKSRVVCSSQLPSAQPGPGVEAAAGTGAVLTSSLIHAL